VHPKPSPTQNLKVSAEEILEMNWDEVKRGLLDPDLTV
jgi:hypothetical protein